MKTVEIFSGTKSFSKVARSKGFSTLTIDNDSKLEPDIIADILTLNPNVIPYRADILWASPPCEGFSVAAIGKNWNKDYTPKHPRAAMAQRLARTTLTIIAKRQPVWWFIENPRGMLRKMSFMQDMRRITVTYCQYGDTRQKPTDIWTNADWWEPRPPCRAGLSCHEAAPRGSKTGTQGIKGARDRGRIPPALFEEILSQMPQQRSLAA